MEVHLVDGTYELFRAHFGAPSSSAPDGRERGATIGLARSLLALLRRDGATHVAVAFDHVIESFRNRLFSGYKTGAGVDPALLAQFEPAERMARALGFVVWPMVEFEADDALATAASRCAAYASVERVLLCTPDKDLAQCVRGDRIVCLDRRRERIMDEAAVVERFGVGPGAIPDWLALVGDAADGIPGVPRWGERSAAAALSAHGDLDLIPDDPERWSFSVRGARALAESLTRHRADARLYRTLATLRRDVPIDEEPGDLEWRGAIRRDVERLSEELGRPGLRDQVFRWRATA